MNKKFFSVVIQDNYLKILCIKKNKVISYGLTKLAPGVVFNDKITRTQLLSDSLDSLFANTKPKKMRAKYAIVEISDAQCFIKKVKLQSIKAEEIEESLRWQLEKLLPLAPSQVYWDWKLIKTDAQGSELLLIAATKQAVDPIIDTFNFKKIAVKAIEPRSMALTKVLATDKKPKIIINLGEQKATIVIGKNSLPYFSTVELIDKNFSNIKKTIEKAVTFYKKENNDEEIKEALICGDSNINEFYSYIKKNIKKLDAQKVAIELKAPEKFKKISLGFISNLGLLIKENIVNLLPDTLKKQYEIKKSNDIIARLIWYFAFFALLLIIFFGLTWMRLSYDLRTTQSDLNNTINVNAGENLKELEIKAQKINQQAKRIQSLFASTSNDTASLLREVNKAVPANLSLSNIIIDYSDKSLKISGLSQSREQMILFGDNLKKIGQIASVDIPLSALEKPQDINFTINCVLK